MGLEIRTPRNPDQQSAIPLPRATAAFVGKQCAVVWRAGCWLTCGKILELAPSEAPMGSQGIVRLGWVMCNWGKLQ